MMKNSERIEAAVGQLEKAVARLRKLLEEIQDGVIGEQDLAEIAAAEEELKTGKTRRVR